MGTTSRFATLLARPGFDPANVLHEVQGRVACGPAGGPPTCQGDDGVLALIQGQELGWAVPSGEHCFGWIQTGRITSWASAAGELTIEYSPPPTHVHHRDPFRVEVRHRASQVLHLTADPSAVADFVNRAEGTLRRHRQAE